MTTGKVKWYDKIKGFGFITTDEGKDIFVHRNSIENSPKGLEENQTVEFEVKESEKGVFASGVTIK